MQTIYKLLLFIAVPSLFLVMGYYIFKIFNRSIRASVSGWQLFLNSVLLILAGGILFTGVFFLLIKAYSYLAASG